MEAESLLDGTPAFARDDGDQRKPGDADEKAAEPGKSLQRQPE